MFDSYYLLIDTSCPRAVVALAQGNNLIAEIFLDDKIKHGERIAHAINELLASEKLSMSNVNSIVVGNGPGAFVGTRLGLATAKGLAMALEVPLITVNTLIALGASGSVIGSGLAVADARRGEFYCQRIQRDATINALENPFTIAYEKLPEITAGLNFITGFDFNLTNSLENIILESFEGPTGQGMLNAFLAKNSIDDETFSAIPLYCREPDAKPAILITQQPNNKA